MELLERTSFLAALAGYADEASKNTGRMVLVAGEAGIGKTTLIGMGRVSASDGETMKRS